MKIIIETIPMNEQRYNTCGDWRFEENREILHVKVSKMRDIASGDLGIDADYVEAIVGIHEVVEALLCSNQGITEKMVDDFDTNKKIAKEVEELEIETGDHPKAPYKQQHTLATGIERILCYAFGVPWFEYEEQLIKMTEEYDDK